MDQEILNLETLKTLQELSDDDDAGFMREIIRTYLENTESRLADARRAHGDGNAAELAVIAHTIKGSSLNVGAVGLAGLMQALEREGRKGLVPDAGRLHSAEVEFARVKSALARYLA